ncbi:metal-dependent hydrolase family protein [Rhizorhabdus histidinilytica]|uniref:metal-dependent hydrolase family protein n=1 Tax=Rhizorhabdus histidinilytica TaxID=439228 RepID=UPI00321F9AB1
MKLLFAGGKVWDGLAREAVAADVLVEDQHVATVGAVPAARCEGARRIDAHGATLIPGMVDAHAHLSFPVVTYAYQIEDTPPEETVLITMHNARTLLDAGFTGAVGAGSPKLRAEVVIRNEIEAGRIPGPRLMASTPTLTATGGLNDTAQIHQERDVAAMVVDGADACRRAVRTGYREGVDLVKVNVSGDDFFPRPSGRTTTLAEDEMRAIGEACAALGLPISAHARSAESIKRALRAGATLINHADFADEEALDMLEAAKDRVFVAPTIGYYHSLLHDSPFDRATLDRMGVEAAMASNVEVHRELRRRGVRAVIGGDYGLAWQPNGANARDVGHFVTYLGYSPCEALVAATRNGGELMGQGAGGIVPGAPADLLLVDGDPLANPALLARSDALLAIVKGGGLHKSPAVPERIA